MDIAGHILPEVAMFRMYTAWRKGCDALMVITEWNEFKKLDLEYLCSLMHQPVIFDGRNIYDPGEDEETGFPLPWVWAGV